MARTLLLLLALFGVGLIFYDTTYFPFSHHPLLVTERLYGTSLYGGPFVLLAMLVFRLWVFWLLLKEAFEAAQWRKYRGNETSPLWSTDCGRDFNQP